MAQIIGGSSHIKHFDISVDRSVLLTTDLHKYLISEERIAIVSVHWLLVFWLAKALNSMMYQSLIA